ncbi:unnamed protein product [Peniophora sp. CBMAI 1063]|nr:unnamed protein product [Peniophora sp. CBMAI 1063]
MAPTARHRLPIELIESVIEAVDSHEDLLSFALTCSYLYNHIQQSGYLQYRELIVSAGHIHLWNHLIENPAHAAQVRVLTIYDIWYQGHIHRTSFRVPSDVSRNTASEWLDARERLVACLPLFTGLGAITIFSRKGAYPAEDDLQATLCRQWNSSIRSLTVRVMDQFPLDMDSLIWYIRDLRELDLSLPSTLGANITLGTEVWPRFCAMLALNPRLEVLRIPPFRGDAPPRTPLPHLPHLRTLHIAEQDASTAIQLAFYAAAHPLITEFSWDTTLDVAITNAPNLPRLERLIDTSPAFVNAMLSGRTSASVRLTKLGRFELTADTLPVLRAVSASSLRALTLSSVDSHRTLAALATMFPDIKELHMPMRLDNDNGWISRIMRSPGITLEEALRLFPRLCIVSGVMHVLPQSAARVKARGAYPCLRRVNGTRVDEL